MLPQKFKASLTPFHRDPEIVKRDSPLLAVTISPAEGEITTLEHGDVEKAQGGRRTVYGGRLQFADAEEVDLVVAGVIESV